MTNAIENGQLKIENDIYYKMSEFYIIVNCPFSIVHSLL